MTVYCSKCGKRIGFLAARYKLKDGSVMCASCIEKHKMEQKEELRKQKEKNREIMVDLISKYLTNKDPHTLVLIREICCIAYWFETYWTISKDYQFILDKVVKERPECVDMAKFFFLAPGTPYLYVTFSPDFIDSCRYKYQSLIDSLESSKVPGLSSFELEKIGEDIKRWKICLNFLDDLEKMGRLFKNKGIKTTVFEMLSVFFEVIREKAKKEQNMPEHKLDKLLDKDREFISNFLDETGLPITKENVIKVRLQVNSEEYNIRATDSKKTSELLKKFNFTCEEAEVKELIEKMKEEIELENFEQNLGAVPEQKLEIDDFTQLNGYEFEDYLKKLFEVLGYTTVQTPSTGDQGADLILSKDGEKIVVQAKKYAGKVSNKAVQEIAAAKNYYNADRGMVVTNSAFTKSAIELAFSNDVELWDGRKLKSIIEDLESGKIKKGEV